MSDTKSRYLPYFQPLNGEGVKDLFNGWHIKEMKKLRISVNEDDNTQRLNLGDYESVCRFNNLIKKCIEGYGFNPDGDYDHLKNEQKADFLKVLERLSPNSKEDDIPEEFEQYINVNNIIDRNFRMPPMSVPKGEYKARPLSHEAITAFNKWVENGMLEHEGGEPYTGVIFTK